jgi:hypothetical protein
LLHSACGIIIKFPPHQVVEGILRSDFLVRRFSKLFAKSFPPDEVGWENCLLLQQTLSRKGQIFQLAMRESSFYTLPVAKFINSRSRYVLFLGLV